jgi:hypothetical protein
MDIKEIPCQILSLKDGDCLIFRLPKEAFAEIASGITGASELEREFERYFNHVGKTIKVKALPFTAELAIIQPEPNGIF